MGVLTQSNIQEIHRLALRILEETGVKVLDKDLLHALSRAGAKLDGEWVRIPPRMVEGALESAPKGFALADAGGEPLPLEPGRQYWGACVHLPSILDFRTGQLRQPTHQDIVECTRLGDALPRATFLHLCDGPCSDIAESLTELKPVETLFLNTTKHVMAAPASLSSARIWADLAEIASSSGDLRKAHLLSAIVSTTSPLAMSPETSQILIYLAKRGVPLGALPGGKSGATAPYPLAGTLLQQTAETLFLIVAIQAVQPGLPTIYAPVQGIMDMRTTRISKGGAEYPLSFTATAEIAAFYGLPSYHALGQADSGRTDVQTGAEKMLQCFCGRGSGLSLVLGMGQLDVGLILSPEQVLIDHEILGVVDRFYQGITVDQDHLAFDAIMRASKGASYVMDDSTMMFLRTEEHHYPRAFDRTGSRRPEDGMVAKAHELVRSTVAAHQPKVSPSKAEDIQRYARKKEKELAGGR